MIAPRPAAGGIAEADGWLRDVLRALERLGLEPPAGQEGVRRGVAERVVAAADYLAVRRELGRLGFARLPAAIADGAHRFAGYHRATGAWTEVRVHVRDGGLRSAGAALVGRLIDPLRRRGLGVALLGPDGAGKSSMIGAVEEQFLTPVRAIYMGLYQGEEDRAPRRRRVPPGVGLIANLARQQGRWLRGAYHRARGRLVLFDRYTYDALLPTDEPQSRARRLRRRLLAAACPSPDLVMILDAPAELLFERKGEHDTALLERHRRRFLDLHRELVGSIVVDTSGPPEQAVRELIDAVWTAYARRWR